MSELVKILSTLTPHDFNTILALLGSGAGVAVALQVIKHFGKLQDAKKTVTVLLGGLSFIASFADWALQYGNQNPKVVIGSHLGWVITAAIFTHRFAVSPAYYKVTSFLNGIYADAEAYRKEQAQNVPVQAATGPEFSLQ
jgi:hypothetical protein